MMKLRMLIGNLGGGGGRFDELMDFILTTAFGEAWWVYPWVDSMPGYC
jgi:hypothetical protein